MSDDVVTHPIRFEGGEMDGRRGFQSHDPNPIIWIPPGKPAEHYVPTITDPDGTLVYRKK